MWLLPDEEGACVGRSFASPRVGHLHPAYALKSLTFCNFSSYGVCHIVVPAEHLLHYLGMVPEGKIHRMPPRHFKVGTAKPGVVGESCLLWGQGIGAVHLGEILAQHHSAFQFVGAWVGALAEVDNSSFLPPTVPGLEHGLEFLVEDEVFLRPAGSKRPLVERGDG